MSETPAEGARPATARRSFSPLDYVDPVPWPWLVHLLGIVNRAWMLPAVLKVTRFDLPEADAARLRAAVNPDTVAFLGPAHPEFLTDWMVDKELSRRVSPLMAHWASYEIVNASRPIRAFWLANNLIANVPGGGGKAYSVRWARRGHGVLLHPEGTATWQAERISTLLPGIVDMALEAARQLAAEHDARPVHLVPVAWRLSFLGDASRGLARDMARVEQGLALARGDRLPVAERFAALKRNLLARQAERLGLAPPRFRSDAGAGYFTAQSEAIAQLRRSLTERYGELDPDLTRAQFQLRKAIRERAASDPEGVRRDRGRLLELMRLASFDPALYDRPRLAQERIAEVLKRTRSSLLTRGLRNAIHNTIPIAAGPRIAHVRVAEPVRVLPTEHADGDAGEDATRAALLAEHRIRLQRTVDELTSESAGLEMERAIPNLLHAG
jgi:hypothetical protein